MAVAGLANSVYHPADYSLLNASVDPRRMGRAFSFHTAAGMLGNAVAPVTMVFLMTLTDWRTALVVCAAGGALVGLLVAFNARALKEREEPETAAARAGAGIAATGVTGIRLLLTLPLLLGLLFFFGISVSQHGIQSFSVSALHAIHDAPLAEATTVLSCYLFASPVGVLAGGWVADRIQRRHDLFAATCFVAMAGCIGAVAALPLPLTATGVLFAVTGLFAGMVSPSRGHAHPLDGPAGRDREGLRLRVDRVQLRRNRRAGAVRLHPRPERPRFRVLGRGVRLSRGGIDGDECG